MDRHSSKGALVYTLQCFICISAIFQLYAQEFDLPVISFSQNPYSVNAGNEVTILCFVDSPNSPIQDVTWMKNGEPIPADERHQMKTGRGSRLSELVIKTTNIGDEGLYTCTATNGLGVGSAETALAVNTVTESADPFGDSQFDVFSGIQGQRVETGSNIFGEDNINVFGDAQGDSKGSLSSPDLVTSLDNVASGGGVNDVATGNNILAQEKTTGETAIGNAGENPPVKNAVTEDTGSNKPVADTVPGDKGKNTLAADVKSENTGDKKPLAEAASGNTGNSIPVADVILENAKNNAVVADVVAENTGSNTEAVARTTAKNDASDGKKKEEKPATENIKLASITNVLNPSKQKSGNNPTPSDTVRKQPIGNKSSKPETKDAPSQKDRIVGGIGGGGFIDGKEGGTCAAECRMDIDACYRPVNCTHYETCFAQDGIVCKCTKNRCAFGTFWNPQINNCDSVTSVHCESDQCRKMKPLETFPSGINCRSYYSCSWQNTSLPHCCDKGFAYDDARGKCVADEKCVIPCSVHSSMFKNRGDVTTKAPKFACFLRPVKDKPTKYWNDVANQEMDCPPPLVYRPDICVCGNSLESGKAPTIFKPTKTCEPVLNINFNGTKIVNHSRRRLWIQSTHTQITKSRKGAQYGRFNGISSRISTPFFENISIKTLLARFRFFTNANRGPETQVLLSNCESKTVKWDYPEISKDLSPSVAIILNRKMNKLIFLASTKDEATDQVMMHLPFKKNDWNNVQLKFDGSRLSARVRVVGKEKQAVEFKNSTVLTGELTPAKRPILIGRCNDKDGFYGYMDMIKIYDCIP